MTTDLLSNRASLKVAAIGECMLEMAKQPSGLYQMAYAGDTYNVAYYAQHYGDQQKFNIDYVTALGNDSFSDQMLLKWLDDGLRVGLVQRVPDCLPGLYFIDNDDCGERHFYYYRSQAPVRSLFAEECGDALLAQLLKYDVWYFSGITLAILHSSSLQKFLDALQQAHRQGILVCFDVNYRPCLWSDIEYARTVVQQALQCSSIAMPSLEDQQQLFGDASTQEALQRLQRLGIPEIVLKNGKHGCHVASQGGEVHYPCAPAAQIVDTTGAGDAFNGVYLAMRLKGQSVEFAAKRAAQVSAAVIGQRGALLASDAMPCDRA